MNGRVLLTTVVLSLSISACSKNTCDSTNGSLTTGQCDTSHFDPSTQATPIGPADAGGVSTHGKMVPLPWESPSHPERIAWSEYVYDLVGGELATKLLPGSGDMATFCPKYNSMTNDQRINFWGFLVAGVSKYESSWNPKSRFRESTMGVDSITGQQVYSEGLMQLSYQDEQWYRYCDFDWDKDKKLSVTDSHKSIFDPKVNLSCGLRILADQLLKKNQIAANSDVYWSTLSPKNKNSKVVDISKITKTLPGCL